MSEQDDKKSENDGGLAEAYLALAPTDGFREAIEAASGFSRGIAAVLGDGSFLADRLRDAGSIQMQWENIDIEVDDSPVRTADAAERTAEHLVLLLAVMRDNVAHAEATRKVAERTAREAELTRVGNEQSAKFSRAISISSLILAIVSTGAAIIAVLK